MYKLAFLMLLVIGLAVTTFAEEEDYRRSYGGHGGHGGNYAGGYNYGAGRGGYGSYGGHGRGGHGAGYRY